MDPAIDGIGRTRTDARDADGRRLPQAAIDETAHRHFSRDAASPGASHAIRQCSEHADS
jgi:hypothetical protein